MTTQSDREGNAVGAEERLRSAEESALLTADALERNRGNITEQDWAAALTRALERVAALRRVVNRGSGS